MAKKRRPAGRKGTSSSNKRTTAKKVSRSARSSRVTSKAGSKNRVLAKATSTNGPIFVYIHGIGDQEGKEELKHKWDLSLFGRDMGTRTRMAYWADILDNDISKRKGKSVKGTHGRKVSLEATALLQEAGINPNNEQALQFVESLAASLAASDQPADRRRGVRTKFLPLPRFLRRPIAEKFLRLLVKDSAAYFFNEEIRRKIKDRLVEQIPADDEPFILVSHSQGTVAAFEVLSERSTKVDVSLFVTVGSPLGIREVQDLIEERDMKLSVPKGVRTWHNFADRLDPVALDATLKSDFVPRERIHDHMVRNEGTKDLLRFNPHSSIGYLAHPKVRTVIHTAAGFDFTGRFVVARDVAERFVGVGVRQPVLIEALHPGYWALDENKEQCQERETRQVKKNKSMDELSGRIGNLKSDIIDIVQKHSGKSNLPLSEALSLGRVQQLRKYVAAHLTPSEITVLAREHAEYNVFAVWRSAEKRKLLTRSAAPLKVDASRVSYAAEGHGITWAVLDTGVRRDHPHFGTEGHTILELWDCTQNTDQPVLVEMPKGRQKDKKGDPDGHGTHVSGIIAGRGKDDGGRMIHGIAPKTKLIVYKVLDEKGFGEDAWIIKAIDDIYRKNAAGAGLAVHGVNLSLGGSFDATVYGCGFSAICNELRDLWRQGVLVCVAAGNEGQIQVLTNDGDVDLNTHSSIGDPANLEDCIAVGSVNAEKPHLYGISYFSSRGPTADGRKKPDVVAPGERIFSANSDFQSGKSVKDLYRSSSGTSMACPHVSGLLAAFLSVRREYVGHPDKVKKILLENCNDLDRDRYHQGAGLPNLMKMLLNT